MAHGPVALAVAGIVGVAAGVSWILTKWIQASVTKAAATKHFFSSLGVALAFFACMMFVESKLQPGMGQMSLQWAFTEVRCRRMLDGMTLGQRSWAGFSFGVDVAFQIAFIVALALGWMKYGRNDRDKTIGIWLGVTSGVLDFLESWIFMYIVGEPKGCEGRLPEVGTFVVVVKTLVFVLSVGGIVIRALGFRASSSSEKGKAT